VIKMKWALLLTMLTLMTGCITQRQLTPEESALRQQMIQDFMAKRAGRMAVAPPATPVTAPVVTHLTESELLDSINAFPTISKRVTFTKKKDGFEVDGRRFMDPEGAIKLYGFDPQTGDVTYLVNTGGNTYACKYVRVTTGLEPVKIGDAVFKNGDWRITTLTGKSYSGSKLIPLGKGFTISREDGSGFVWSPDKKLVTFAVPEGFQIADFQNGDISGTRYILCERMIEQKNANGSFGDLMNSVQALGSTLGIGQKEDYLLLNIDTAAEVPINISYDLKNEVSHSNCRPAGKFVNKCANVQFYESLYDKYGEPNGGHYYWGIYWYNTASGPLLIFKDNNARDLYAQNLANNDKAIIMSRMLGINWFTSAQNSDGKVSVTAKMGFSKESVADVESELAVKLAEAAAKPK
jgi:hypothetical protein